MSFLEIKLEKLIINVIILAGIKKKKYPLISINYITLIEIGEKTFKICITLKN